MKKTRRFLPVILAFIIVFTAVMPVFAADETQKKYLVLGDSIGYGAGVLNSDEACFGKIVADTAGFDFTNDAVNGYRTEDLIKHLDKEKVSADVKSADIISISIGGNDFLRGNIKSLVDDANNKNYEQFDEIAAQFYVNFCTIIEKIKTLNPNAVILVQTLYNPGFETVREAYQQGADRLNAGYRKYLAENDGAYELLEVADAFAGHGEYIAADYIHPSAEGNVVIAKTVLEKLNALGLTDKTEPVIKYEGIDQNEMFSLEFLKYIIRKFLKIVMNYVNVILNK